MSRLPVAHFFGPNLTPSQKRLEALKRLAGEGETWRDYVGSYKDRFAPGNARGLYYNSPSDKGERWIENISEGLRFVGFADKLTHSIRHTGWFINEFHDEAYRGAVYQLPARKGKALYVFGYADPYNEDCAFIEGSITDEEKDAALRADDFAQIKAEAEQRFQAEESARCRRDDIIQELKALRLLVIAILGECRAARKAGMQYQALSAAIRAQITAKLEERAALLKEKSRLSDEWSFE